MKPQQTAKLPGGLREKGQRFPPICMTQVHLAGLPASGRLRDALDGLEQGVGEHGQAADGRDRVREGSCSNTSLVRTQPDAALGAGKQCMQRGS